jgi:hypothetical protein
VKPIISFLVGSGFSRPEGLPGVKELNQRLSKIDESEILIHTDQRAFFLNGQTDLNRWSRQDERIFLQEFLEYYCSKILKSRDEFHYESFYDFYSGYLTKNENKGPIEDFYNQFNEKYFKERDSLRDCYNRIADFNRTFNQLLASQLHKTQYLEDVSTLNYPQYGAFISFIKQILKTSDIKFHSLNHDLFFDWLGRHHSDLWEFFADGFQLEGSPYYGLVNYDFNAGTAKKVTKSYYVKLERFVDRYDKPLSLFKLHGSIYNTVVYNPDKSRIRLRDNYAVSQYYMEVKDPKIGEYRMELLWDEVAPDFLSGTTNKTRYYSEDPYYKILFQHFEKNLASSDVLVVVGYGFHDAGINEYIEKNFLLRGKQMVVIDPVKPTTDLIAKYNAMYIQHGVTDLPYQEYLKILPASHQPR